MSEFVISKTSNGEFQFTLKAGNGHVILTSERYAAKTGCLNAVDSAKKKCSSSRGSGPNGLRHRKKQDS
jgi:uncharacterized protein YegP (UPF0339 family)